MRKIFGSESYMQLNRGQILPVASMVVGLVFVLSVVLFSFKVSSLSILCAFGAFGLGGLLFIFRTYGAALPGIKNNNVEKLSFNTKGKFAWFLAMTMTGFYVCLYWYPEYLENLIRALDSLSLYLRGKGADQWFLYGSFYTAAVLIMGVRYLYRYRHSRYQIIRTLSLMFFQLIFAYLVPAFMAKLNQPEFYFSYFWPLDYYKLYPQNWASLSSLGLTGKLLFFWGVGMIVVATPVLTYLYGKRWYCSWVCGCGGLAETLGDPFRQLSDKSIKAWRFERVIIYSVLGLVCLTTASLWLNSLLGGAVFGGMSGYLSRGYGFFIGAVFSGVIGVGFYPLLGSRVWCRFGCPMAAILGILQKFFSRFRITTNGSQCISCGNCSKYCEMGIDVRWYAQRGQDIVRASCVGCGVCSEVCPRGVLRLENGPVETRRSAPINLVKVNKSS
jgi:ferredoxin-type protein NapH